MMMHLVLSKKILSSAVKLLTILTLCSPAHEAIALPRETAFPFPSFVYPVMNPRKSSSFGGRLHPVLHYLKHHNGIDLAAPSGSQIRAIAGGTVVFADPYAGYGNLVVVQHTNGITSHYGHCDKISVRPGTKVKPGQIIATVGETGITTGPHLHFELRLNGIPQNPEQYLPGLVEAAAG